MFDFLLDAENLEKLYSVVGIIGVSILLYIGSFIVKKTKTTADDEFMKKLQEIHKNNITKKAVDKVQKTINNTK